MKRYLVFACDSYYPRGGWNDFAGTHDSLPEALICAANAHCDWWHVIDTQTMTVVEFGRRKLP